MNYLRLILKLIAVCSSKALDLYLSLAILRLQEGLDYSDVLKDSEVMNTTSDNNKHANPKKIAEVMTRNVSYSQISQG